MRVRGEGCVLDGGEGKKSPPLPFVDLPDDEAISLIKAGIAKAFVEGEEVEVEVAFTPPEPEPVLVLDAPREGENPAQVVVQEPAQEPPAAAVEPIDRQATLIEHFELLSPDDFVSTGPRAGKPKVSVMKDSTGFEDLTAEEVDAAFALKEAGQE